MYYYDHDSVEPSEMLGKTMKSVVQHTGNHGDQLTFTTTEGQVYVFVHIQDCCENVRVEDITGDLDDLVGSPLLQSEGVTSSDTNKPDDWSESWTWTFYKFATNKGYVTVRWLGESNGYYSESVDLFRLKK
jgi:hypothetical protein|tara:strand:- start:778 stop:1170 length:393 start_codon:yes stop_codon:yes gene_type:complete